MSRNGWNGCDWGIAAGVSEKCDRRPEFRVYYALYPKGRVLCQPHTNERVQLLPKGEVRVVPFRRAKPRS